MPADPGRLCRIWAVEAQVVFMSDEPLRPAWSQQFTPEAIQELVASGPIAGITPEWAWGGGTGRGMRVAVVDSGIEYDHPALEGSVRGGVIVEYDESCENNVRIEPDEYPSDLSGHGTACAGIIHSIAPEAEIYSARVLGRDMRGRAIQFAAGLDWAIDAGIRVINLSLSTSREEYYALFHELADNAYFKNAMLVSAVNNMPVASYPSLYSSVVSVAAHEGQHFRVVRGDELQAAAAEDAVFLALLDQAPHPVQERVRIARLRFDVYRAIAVERIHDQG